MTLAVPAPRLKGQQGQPEEIRIRLPVVHRIRSQIVCSISMLARGRIRSTRDRREGPGSVRSAHGDTPVRRLPRADPPTSCCRGGGGRRRIVPEGWEQIGSTGQATEVDGQVDREGGAAWAGAVSRAAARDGRRGLKGRSAPRDPETSPGERVPAAAEDEPEPRPGQVARLVGRLVLLDVIGARHGGNPSPDDERLAIGKPGVGVGITSIISPRSAQATRRRRDRLDLSDRHRVMIILGSHPGRGPAPDLASHYASGAIGVTADLSTGNFETHAMVVGIDSGGPYPRSVEFYSLARTCKGHGEVRGG